MYLSEVLGRVLGTVNRRSDALRSRRCGRLREPREMQRTDHDRSAETVMAGTSAIVRRIRSGIRQIAGVQMGRLNLGRGPGGRIRAGPFLCADDRYIGQRDDEEVSQESGQQEASGNPHAGQSNTWDTARIPDQPPVLRSSVTQTIRACRWARSRLRSSSVRARKFASHE